MRYSVLEEFFGQEVEASVSGKAFTGIINKIDNTQTEVSIIPSRKYEAHTYGKAIVETEYIRSIRLLKPRVPKDSKKDTSHLDASTDDDYEDINHSDNVYYDEPKTSTYIKKFASEDQGNP